MAILDIRKLKAFERKVKIKFPNPAVAGATLDVEVHARFKYLNSDEYKELMKRGENGLYKKSQREMCSEFVEWINPECIKGLETPEEAVDFCIGNIAIQNAFIQDYAECTSGFVRKN